MTIVIPCSATDEQLLPLLVRNLRSIGLSCPVLVAPCAAAPPATDLPSTLAVRWGTMDVVPDMLRSLQYAARQTGSETVFKIDADIFFNRRPDWVRQGGIGLMGFNNPSFKWTPFVWGGCYGLPVAAIEAMLESNAYQTTIEDMGISRRAAETGLPLLPKSGFAGWPDIRGDVVHLGQHYTRRSELADRHRELARATAAHGPCKRLA